jgi:hypothetical protein
MPTWCVKKPAGVISKKPAGVISKKPAAGCGVYRPVFKTGDIAMKAVFDSGVPFSNGLYTAVVNKNTKGPADVQFVKQIATEDPEQAGVPANKTRVVHRLNLICCTTNKFQAQHLRL